MSVYGQTRAPDRSVTVDAPHCWPYPDTYLKLLFLQGFSGMLRNARATYVDFCAGYAARDFERCAAQVADEVSFAIYIDRDLAPFGGVSIGKAIMHKRWQMVAQAFDLLKYEIIGITEDEEKLRGLVAYHFHHKATGEDISGTMRHIIHFRDSLMVRMEEHHDRTRVEAFFRLIQSIAPLAAEQPPASEPKVEELPTRTGCDSKA